MVVGHGHQGAAGAVGVVDVAHDGHGGQRLAGAVGVGRRRGQLGAQRQVLLDLLALVEVELGALQLALDLRDGTANVKRSAQVSRGYCEMMISLGNYSGVTARSVVFFPQPNSWAAFSRQLTRHFFLKIPFLLEF